MQCDGVGNDQPESSSGDSDRHQAEFQLYGEFSIWVYPSLLAHTDLRLILPCTDRAELRGLDQRWSEIRTVYETSTGLGQWPDRFLNRTVSKLTRGASSALLIPARLSERY